MNAKQKGLATEGTEVIESWNRWLSFAGTFERRNLDYKK